MCPAAEDHQVLLGGPLHSGHGVSSSGRRVCRSGFCPTGAARPTPRRPPETCRVDRTLRPRPPRPAGCPRACAAPSSSMLRCGPPLTPPARRAVRRGVRRCPRRCRRRRRSRPARRTCCWTRSGRAGRPWCGASRPRRSWRRSCRRRCWCPRRSRRRRRRRGAGTLPRRRSGRSWSRRRRRSCRRCRARCRGAGRRTGRRSRPAPITASSPWVRTTRAPAPTSQSLSVVSGPITASSPTTVAPSSWVPGRIVTSWASTTSASIQVVAGSMTVTPSRIQRSTIRRFSSRPSSASWTRSLAPSVCITSSIG